ncbi:hypothetical protein VIGAN_09218100 [Vigna angularis var. angularis]|uniref:Uncharacterized protein n=1 Tax=Vigna angularis var. angularis TaxID=157739 RepID=A0A0S3T077_PHAAN|nr:hypothetical protein VIGAN_09218100 [Vigna angularis var. angularis]
MSSSKWATSVDGSPLNSRSPSTFVEAQPRTCHPSDSTCPIFFPRYFTPTSTSARSSQYMPRFFTTTDSVIHTSAPTGGSGCTLTRFTLIRSIFSSGLHGHNTSDPAAQTTIATVHFKKQKRLKTTQFDGDAFAIASV